MAEPAPYGGFMTRTLDAENEEKDKLKEQQVEVTINGETETLRPEALHIRGVDNLATDDIKAFIDFYLNFTESPHSDAVYEAKEKEIWFRIQWIDDSNVNVIFKTHNDARAALDALLITDPNREINTNYTEDVEMTPEYLSSIVQERETKPYSPTIEFHKDQKALQDGPDLFEDKQGEQEDMDEDESTAILYLRQSLQSDRKVKNAAVYSRYYLLHGEPDRLRPRPARRERGHFQRDEEDLFATKLNSRESRETTRGRDDEEDLFASRMRERSPGR